MTLGPKASSTRAAALLAGSALLSGCSIPPGMMGEQVAGPMVMQELPPPGFGTLRQEEVSISLSSGDLRLMVTPLSESVTLVTAPDTYQRLSGLAASYSGIATGSLFLVSFFSEQPDTRFVPEEVQLISKGVRIRPATIRAITPSWGGRRVAQRETEMAVYAFEGDVDLESEMTLVYGLDQSSAWSVIRTRVQAERARAHARSRSGLGGVGSEMPEELGAPRH
jgi:hypothetical protein